MILLIDLYPEAFVLKARASLEQARRKRSIAEAEVHAAEAMLRESAAATGDLILETATWDVELSAPVTLEDALRQAESGTPIGDLCRQYGIAEQTFSAWKKKYACKLPVDRDTQRENLLAK